MDSFCTNCTNNVTDREHLLSFQRFEILILANQWMRKRQWQSTPVLLPGTSHGRRSLVGYSPWGREESDMTRDFTFTFHFHALEKEMTTTPVFLPGGSQGWCSLVGCHLWGRTESDTTETT